MNNQVNPRLLGLAGPLRDSIFALPTSEVPVGRDPGNLLAIPDPSLSRRHCIILPAEEGYLIRDLESRNGTYVNGVAVKEGSLKHGDQISIRQPPGERNALGRIKFMFPNEHSVYLHDTPTRGLFAKAERAFSHGCVRVDQPFRLAAYVLNDAATWPEKRIEKMIGGAERTINLGKQLPVHLAYFTLAADTDGTLHRFGDLYGLDTRLEAMLAPRK